MYPGGHWITIRGKHIFIADEGTDFAEQHPLETRSWYVDEIQDQLERSGYLLGDPSGPSESGVPQDKIDATNQLTDSLMANPEWRKMFNPERVSGGPYDEEMMRDWTRSQVHDVLDSWESTSADKSSYAISLQMAAAEEFGLTSAKVMTTAEIASAAKDSLGRSWSGIQEQYKTRDIYKCILRQQYNNTQAYFQKRGISEVTLVRGVKWDSKGKVPSDLKWMWAEADRETRAFEPRVSSNPLSSWSSHLTTASSFAMNRQRASEGLVLLSHVPVSRIASTGRTGMGVIGEGEYILLGGEDRVRAAISNREIIDSDSDSYAVELTQQLARGG